MPIKAREDMGNPKDYSIRLCFDFNKTKCLEFLTTTDGYVKDKKNIVQQMIYAWGGITVLDDGTVVNLEEFKVATVTLLDDVGQSKRKSPLTIIK